MCQYCSATQIFPRLVTAVYCDEFHWFLSRVWTINAIVLHTLLRIWGSWKTEIKFLQTNNNCWKIARFEECISKTKMFLKLSRKFTATQAVLQLAGVMLATLIFSLATKLILKFMSSIARPTVTWQQMESVFNRWSH